MAYANRPTFPFTGQWEVFDYESDLDTEIRSAEKRPALWEFFDVNGALYSTTNPFYYGRLHIDVENRAWDARFYYFPTSGELEIVPSYYDKLRVERISEDEFRLYTCCDNRCGAENVSDGCCQEAKNISDCRGSEAEDVYGGRGLKAENVADSCCPKMVMRRLKK